MEAIEWQGVRRNGDAVSLSVQVSPILGPDGALVGFLGVGKDITARKAAELELARLATAIGNATDGVIVTDAAAHVVYVNPACERMLGLRATDLVGRPLRD